MDAEKVSDPEFMETNKALEIVLNMARRLYNNYGELCAPAVCLHDATTALAVVEEFITLNNFEDIDAPNTPATT